MTQPAPEDHDKNHPVKRGFDPNFFIGASVASFLALIIFLRCVYLALTT